MNTRKLSLKRESLALLTNDELDGVAAGTGLGTVGESKSCLDYISCWAWQCLTRYPRCIE